MDLRYSGADLYKYSEQSLHDKKFHLFSSTGTPGSGVTSEPVAIKMLFAEISVEVPSGPFTDTVFLPDIDPHPFT